MSSLPSDPGPLANTTILGRRGWIVLIFSAAIFLVCIASPPRLLDDFDAAQAQMGRNMLESGDWVTPRLNSIVDFEKPPLIYWMEAVSYSIFGVHDWAARLPLALAIIFMCWMTYRFAAWAIDEESGLYAGIVLCTSVGLFLFSRALIPDSTLMCCIAGAMFCWFLALEHEAPAKLWPTFLGLFLALGVLDKGLIAIVFPCGVGLGYMLFSGQLFDRTAWKRIAPWVVVPVFLLLAAPWFVLITIRNPPVIDFTMHAESGEYHGFFWFFFINEHVLRFMNKRYPHDYTAMPLFLFWILTLVWFFPWSAYVPSIFRMSFRPTDRAGRVRLFALCWLGTVMLFFTISTRQEYYSMPMYPALALLLGSAMAQAPSWVKTGNRILAISTGLLLASLIAILLYVRNMPSTGDIAQALSSNPANYTLSLGHMSDLTLHSFAFLKLPLALAIIALLIGFISCVFSWHRNRTPLLALALMMAVFFHAARLAMMKFDSYLGSYPIAEKLQQLPTGRIISAYPYFEVSSVFFYTNHEALFLNARVNNLEYGSYTPNALKIFIGDKEFKSYWTSTETIYLILDKTQRTHIEHLVDAKSLYLVIQNADALLVSNHPVQ